MLFFATNDLGLDSKQMCTRDTRMRVGPHTLPFLFQDICARTTVRFNLPDFGIHSITVIDRSAYQVAAVQLPSKITFSVFDNASV